MPARDKQTYTIQAVEHALDLLEVLCEEGERTRIGNLSEKLGMNKISMSRLLATFQHRGYVEKEKGSYRLGLSAFETGQKILCRMNLLRQARPVMERLVRKCNEAAYFSVPRGTDILFLHMVDTVRPLKTISLAGQRFPLAQTSAGHLVIAFPPKAVSQAACSVDHWLSPEEIGIIRERGFSYDYGGLGEEIATVSVPLFNMEGDLAGGLSLVGPAYRMTKDRVEEYFLPPLKESGEIISSRIGYLGHYLRRDSN